ncbi:MAG: aspartate carbamoyltransferase regulatory subunit [Promethearchaeota archaeon]
MTRSQKTPSTPANPDGNKTLQVRKISNGTVIDHITAGYALAVLEILGITGREGYIIYIAMNVQSKRMGMKDIIKVEGRELTTDEINKIALIAPIATINIIREYRVHAKHRITLPDKIEGIVHCSNPSCITNNERGITNNFKVIQRNPVTIRCTYCQHITSHDNIINQLLGLI